MELSNTQLFGSWNFISLQEDETASNHALFKVAFNTVYVNLQGPNLEVKI